MPRRSPGRRKGQHFLVSGAIADRIAEIAEVGSGDVVLEIGPGKGALTESLAARAKKVIALEIDEDLTELLRKKFSHAPRVEIIHTDALTYNYAGLPKGTKVVANLPYYISTPLIRRLLEAREKVPVMVLMLQKEVAERIAAGPGSRSYGALSVFVRLYAEPEIRMDVPPSCFSPRPKVDSAVVKFAVHEVPAVPVSDEKGFDRMVAGVFSQRRKTLLNALAMSLGVPREETLLLLKECGIDPQRRPETLTLRDFASLSRLMRSHV